MRNPLDVWAGLATVEKVLVLVVVLVTLPVSLPLLVALVLLAELS